MSDRIIAEAGEYPDPLDGTKMRRWTGRTWLAVGLDQASIDILGLAGPPARDQRLVASRIEQALDPNTPSDVLGKLALSDEPDVAIAAAANPNTPEWARRRAQVEQSRQMSKVGCPNGHDNPEGAAFCMTCGSKTENLCPAGHANPTGAALCATCGKDLIGGTPAANPAQAVEQTKLLATTPVRSEVPHAKKRTSAAKWWTTIIAVLLAIGVLVAIVTWDRATSKESASENTGVAQANEPVGDNPPPPPSTPTLSSLNGLGLGTWTNGGSIRRLYGMPDMSQTEILVGPTGYKCYVLEFPSTAYREGMWNYISADSINNPVAWRGQWLKGNTWLANDEGSGDCITAIVNTFGGDYISQD